MCKIQKTGPWVSTAWKIDLGDKQEVWASPPAVTPSLWSVGDLLSLLTPYQQVPAGWLNNADCILKGPDSAALWWMPASKRPDGEEMVSEKYLRKEIYLVLLRFSSSMEHPVWNEPPNMPRISCTTLQMKTSSHADGIQNFITQHVWPSPITETAFNYSKQTLNYFPFLTCKGFLESSMNLIYNRCLLKIQKFCLSS